MSPILFLLLFCIFENGVDSVANGTMEEVFSWKQIGYDFEGVRYTKDTIYDRNPNVVHFPDFVQETDKFFVQYNNVPIGLEVNGSTVFITVPRRRIGIPSTLNYVDTSSSSPLLKPYPDPDRSMELVSVYRPRIDVCGRLWMVDTGLLEIPEARRQVQAPSIIIYDLKTNSQVLNYSLKSTDLVNNRTSGGLTSITVDVDPSACDDAYAYVTDLATEGLIVFSLKQKDSWRISHPSFAHDPTQANFTVGGYTIPWLDGLFSLALVDSEEGDKRKAFFHPMVSSREFSVSTEDLKSKKTEIQVTDEGTRGLLTQSGNHAFDDDTRTLFFANVAQDAILCWNVDTPLVPENVAMAAQDHEKLVYIADLKVVKDEVWVLVNQMPVFVFSSLNKDVPNFFVHKGKVKDLIRGTPCDRGLDERGGETMN